MSDGKQRAAEKALEWIERDTVVGVGTGTTVRYFIEALARVQIAGAVSSSVDSTEKLRAAGIRVLELEEVDDLAVYVDGADECDPHGCLIKGGGGALTREKILAEAARKFVCIVGPNKRVPVLGRFPLPIEVIPMARNHVASTIAQRTGGRPVWRQDFVTDNGNVILDVHGLHIADPTAVERKLNQIPGIVTVGLFAHRRADVLVVGSDPVEVVPIAAQG